MVSLAQDLETLQTEERTLDQQLARFRFLRLLLFSLLVVGLWLGYALALARVRANGDNLQSIRAEIRQLSLQLGEDAPRFDRAEDPIGFLAGSYDEKGRPYDAAWRDPDPALDQEQADTIRQEIQENRKYLRAVYDAGYSFAVPLPEIEPLEVDLREWMYAVPLVLFLFIASEAYRQIQSKKCSLLKLVAAYRLPTASAEEIPTLEALRFSGPGSRGSAFVRHPGAYIRWLRRFWLLLVVYLLLDVILFVPPWQHDGDLFWLALWVSGLVGALGIYAAAYIRHACGQLEAEVAGTIEWTPPVPWTARQWARGQRVASWVRARLRPRFSLSTGSILILLTLVLPLALSPSKCGPWDVEPGHKLITGADGTVWNSSYLLGERGLLLLGERGLLPREFVKASVNYLGRGLYSLAIVAAVFTLLLLVVASVHGPQWLQDRRLLCSMAALTGTIALFALADYAWFGLGLFMLWAEPALLWVFGWLVPVIVWLRFAFSSQPSVKARWPRVRSELIILYLPLVLSHSGLVIFGISEGMWGLPVYLFGVLLLASGYLRLAADQAVFAEVEQTASLASGSHAGAVEGDPEEAHHVRG